MQVNLNDSGTWIFTTDQYHVKENFDADMPQGWLARDHDDWVRSHQMIKALKKVCSYCKYDLKTCLEADTNRSARMRP
jgi:hypothetical protein